MLMFPFYCGLNVGNMELAEIFHAVVGVLFVALISATSISARVGMEGAFGAMGEGTVDLNWAKEHHIRSGSRRSMARGTNGARRWPARPNRPGLTG